MREWQISDAIRRPATLAGGPARSGPARGKPRRQAEDLRRRGARRRQDLRDAAAGARPQDATATTSSSASSRRTAARRPRRCSTASRSIPRRRARVQGPVRSRRWTSTPSSPAGRRSSWSTSSPTPTRPAAAIRSAISTSRSCSSHGIDVYTTVNIQHIESLNDVVAQITHVRVRETVPDSIFDRADAVELVDLTPDDLIQRLKEGKVYVPKQAERALEHFFSPDQPDGAARAGAAPHRRARRRAAALARCRRAPSRDPGPRASASWSASARIRAPPGSCATPSAWPTGCTRPGRRSTSRAGAACSSSEEERDRIADTLRLAETLGGEAITIPGGDRRIADDVIAYAHANNVTQIIIGKSTRSRWFEILHGSVVHDLVRRSGNISVHVIAGDELSGEPIPQQDRAHRRGRRSRSIRAPIWRRCSRSPSRSASASRSSPGFGIENVDLVFLTAIVGVAVRFGLWPSLFASVAASLCYNFFFLPPIYTFTITDPTNVAAFVFFIVMAVLVSNVAARVRTQAVAAMARARTTEVALCLQPQARRRRHARRRAVGDRLPDRADAEGARRAAAAGERLDRGARPAIRRRTRSTRPISRPRNGPGRTTARPGAAPTRCPAPSGCSCRCAPAAARSASSASTATSRGRC